MHPLSCFIHKCVQGLENTDLLSYFKVFLHFSMFKVRSSILTLMFALTIIILHSKDSIFLGNVILSWPWSYLVKTLCIKVIYKTLDKKTLYIKNDFKIKLSCRWRLSFWHIWGMSWEAVCFWQFWLLYF